MPCNIHECLASKHSDPVRRRVFDGVNSLGNSMKIQVASVLSVLCIGLTAYSDELPKPLASGMKNPESVCIGGDGRTYVTEIGEFGKDGDGQVSVIVDGKAKAFATGMNDPKGIVAFKSELYVTDKNQVLKVDAQGKSSVFVKEADFPAPPLFLNDIAVEPESGVLFVSDTGDLKGAGGKVFRIDIKSGKAELLLNSESIPGLNAPNGVLLDGKTHLLLVDFGSGILHRIQLSDKSVAKVGEGFDGADGLTWGKQGQLFVTSWKTGKVYRMPKLGEKATLVTDKFEQAADSCLDSTGKFLLIPDMKSGVLIGLPAN